MAVFHEHRSKHVLFVFRTSCRQSLQKTGATKKPNLPLVDPSVDRPSSTNQIHRLPPFVKDDSGLCKPVRIPPCVDRATFIPSDINYCKLAINWSIFKNPNFQENTRVEDLFTEIPNCLYKNVKTFPIFYWLLFEILQWGAGFENRTFGKKLAGQSLIFRP